MKDLRFIPYGRPDIGEEEIAEALRSGWFTTGPGKPWLSRSALPRLLEHWL
jgi:dTDP-4-amino-4,6-dideoxygalactose transaminase